MNAYMSQIKHLLMDKKSKVTIYVIGVLWTAVIMQIAVNTFIRPSGNLLEAFVNTNSEVSSFELEMAANYGNGYLSESDKTELITYIGRKIGLQVDNYDMVINREYGDCEVYINKTGKNADTLIKIISIKKEDSKELEAFHHYIIVRLKLFTNPDSILKYRDVISEVFNELKVSDVQTNMQISSKYNGKLDLDEMNKIADSMIGNLEGKVAYENRDDKLFTIYGYTGLLPEYVSSLGNKINIHVAIHYDEEADSTNVFLGTPVINGGY